MKLVLFTPLYVAKVCFAVALCLLLPTELLSQNRSAENWYFGQKFGMTFANGTVARLTDSEMIINEGGATWSDPQTGELVLYTDGLIVWDRTHNLMPGSVIAGVNAQDRAPFWSTTQSALILPHPGDPNLLYIFNPGSNTTDPIANPTQFYEDAVTSMSYLVVALDARGGLGDVTDRGILRSDIRLSEKITGIYDPCGSESLIVSVGAGRNTNLYVWTLGLNGLEENPIESDFGNIGQRHDVGEIKFNVNSDRLAEVNDQSPNNPVRIYEFDRTTKTFSAPLMIQHPRGQSIRLYSVSFSPDGQSLYTMGRRAGVERYSLEDFTAEAISASRTVIDGTEQYWEGALQVGPDRAMYILHAYNQLSRINNPDAAAAELNIERNILDFGPSLRGLTYGWMNFIDFMVLTDRFGSRVELDATAETFEVCAGETVQLNAAGAAQYEWEPAELFDDNTLANPRVRVEQTTTFRVRGSSGSCSQTVELTIQARDPVELTINSDTTICLGDSLQLRVTGAEQYEWAAGTAINDLQSDSPRVAPRERTLYEVRGSADEKCDAVASVLVSVARPPEVKPLYMLPDTSAEPGSQLRIPIIVDLRDAILPQQLPPTRLRIVNNALLLRYANLIDAVLLNKEIVDGELFVDIEIPAQLVRDSLDTLAYIEYLPLLNSKLETVLGINDIQFLDAPGLCGLEADVQNGNFSVNDYCLDYGILWRRVLRINAQPNPADQFFDLFIQPAEGADVTRVTCVDRLGDTFINESYATPNADPLNLQFNCSDWPSGLYIIRVQSDRTTRSLRIQVVH